MGPLDAIGHVLNLVLPACGLGALSAAVTKLLWRRELSTVTWARLATAAVAANIAVVLLCLMLFGRDGTIAGYAAMVAACAFTLWWRGFGPGRPRRAT